MIKSMGWIYISIFGYKQHAVFDNNGFVTVDYDITANWHDRALVFMLIKHIAVKNIPLFRNRAVLKSNLK